MTRPNKKFSLFCTIVDFGKGDKILNESRKLGITGGTFLLGKGTVINPFLNFLGFDEARKEILIMIIDEDLEDTFHDELTKKFHFDKPDHGIAFSMPVKNVLGMRGYKYIPNAEKRGVDSMEYEAIFTIVDKGVSDDVIEAAKSAGSTGGTVIHGRGAGSEEKAKLFNLEIEPEKDILLILSKVNKTESIVKAIGEKIDIDNPGAGIVFVLDVNRTSGIFKK